MIGILAEKGIQTASELAKPFNMTQPSISKHLKVLEKAAMITRNIDGRVHRFSLKPSALDEADAWINRHKNFWQGSLNQLSNLVEELQCGDDSDNNGKS